VLMVQVAGPQPREKAGKASYSIPRSFCPDGTLSRREACGLRSGLEFRGLDPPPEGFLLDRRGPVRGGGRVQVDLDASDHHAP
jgi:hypothetical protein